MIKLRIIILFFFLVNNLSAEKNIRIGLFQDRLLNSFVFHCLEGEYSVHHQTGHIMLKKGELIYLSLSGDSILLSDGDLNFAYYQRLEMKDVKGDGIFRLRPVDPAGEARNYEGGLEVLINHESLLLINLIEMSKYLAGVVETEGGPASHIEYYKAQAVLCRTYAINNFYSHSEEGFNLCDHTHCQAYKGLSEQNPDIAEAVLATHNLVLTGRFLTLVNAVYHSNSGGETQRADNIWTGGAEYLQAIIDPFSLGQPNSKWEKTIPLELWKNYLVSNNIQIAGEDDPEELLITQPHRRRFFVPGNDTLRIDRIRADFKLRSGFFDMQLKNDSVVFYGKGYGHGVGMSQEGAMNMARQGFYFSDILRFYYHQVQIRDIMDIPDRNLPEEFRYK